MFTVPANVRALKRDQVLHFVEERVYPHEARTGAPLGRRAIGLVDNGCWGERQG